MKKILLFALVIAAAAIAAFAGTQRICSMPAPSGRAAVDGLGLSADQRKAVDALESEFSKTETPLCMELCRKRADLLRTLARKDAVDAEVEAKLAEISALEAKLEARIAGHVLRIKGLLEPAQAEKYMNGLHSEMQCPIDMSSSRK